MDLENMPIDVFDGGFVGEDPFESGGPGLDFTFTPGELKELDANELETLLNAYEDIDAAEILFGSDQDSVDPQLVREEEVSYGKDSASVLLITIPEQMQVDPAFDSITSINLERKVLGRIADVSAGHDGCYLPISQLPASDEMIVRRRPLRVIDHVHNSLTINVAETVIAVEQGKRKQSFVLTRDDRVEFSSVKYSRLRPKDRIRNTRDKCFQWASSDEDTDDAMETADVPARCSFCNRTCKNLDQHKCKKMLPVVELTNKPVIPVTDSSLMFCVTCHKPFKSKKGLVAHMKKCNKKQLAGGRSKPASSAKKRSLRSRSKK